MESDPVDKLLWQPSPESIRQSNLTKFINWQKAKKSRHFPDYNQLWKWSTDNIDEFWSNIWEYFNILADGTPQKVTEGEEMPDIKWFEGTRVNYCEHIFRQQNDEYPAIIYASEQQPVQSIEWKELRQQVASFATFLKNQGVVEGDRVAAYLPNIPEATVAFLATNALGAIWTSTSPDFGIRSVIDRFSQVDPKVLISVDGYSYNGKQHSRVAHIARLSEELTSVESVVVVNRIDEEITISNYTYWEDALKREEQLVFHRVPFEHPIWVLYSSGTTGLPKPITHSHGGMLLEHLKYLTFHNDIQAGDRCFWYTTTGWMMWNYIQASLLCGGTIVLYDGAPNYPDLNILWKLAAETRITHFGTSAGFIMANMKAALNPGDTFDLGALRSIGSTGSPLPPEGFDWCYEHIKHDLWLASISGGTDVCSAFVGGNPILPVYSGEIQCRALGCKLEAFDEDGQSLINEVGEMVISKPMPCMPIYFWNDPKKERYRESYFSTYTGVWRHGDWTSITSRGGVIIYGRSDSTLNRGGVRIGTSEIYRAVESMEEVKDSLIICLEKENDFFMPLFVVTNNDSLDDALKAKIVKTIRSQCSPRHVPDEIIQIQAVPYTISGKKVETPIKKILSGESEEKAIKADALRNPETLEFFRALRKDLKLSD